MIDTKELRLGNLFQDEDETPCYFAGAWERKEGWIYRDSGGNTYKEMQMYPILLTTDILDKCGFIIQNGCRWHERSKILLRWAEESVQYYSFMYNLLADSTKIKYVHQLQNLYFTLTGTEIKIKL
jgi:hypothetical protein